MFDDAGVIQVLLAEDNEDDMLLLREALERTGSVKLIGIVKDGAEAMAYLLQEGRHAGAPRPALLLLDINMPKKDGFEVLGEIKSNPTLRALPVIMLTTSRRQEDVVRSYAGGACSFISKPSSLDGLDDMASRFASYWTRVANVPSHQ